MIFVTVGTHEQGFDRLLKKIDLLKEKKTINEEIIVQYGYSTYIPQNCKSYKLIGYEQMQEHINQARIIITHGGPASFIAPLVMGKIPIVVPRQKEYGEHVNNHQVEFVKQVVDRDNNLIAIYNIDELENAILNYDSIAKDMMKEYKSNNKEFTTELEREIKKLF